MMALSYFMNLKRNDFAMSLQNDSSIKKICRSYYVNKYKCLLTNDGKLSYNELFVICATLSLNKYLP